MTYIEKPSNLLRIPEMNKNYEEYKAKRKTIKKTPKRTIQKIIKKNKSRRKLYLNQATIEPTKPPNNGDELDQFYAQEELMQKNDNFTTTQNQNQKKKRKWNAKVARYPMPFQHMVSKKDSHKRYRRSEMQFLKAGKKKSVIKDHIKRYW